jgi:hypothetical protein
VSQRVFTISLLIVIIVIRIEDIFSFVIKILPFSFAFIVIVDKFVVLGYEASSIDETTRLLKSAYGMD